MNETTTVENGIKVIRNAGGSVKWRSDCKQCQALGENRFMVPDHDAASGCRSGGHPHCTCDGCF